MLQFVSLLRVTGEYAEDLGQRRPGPLGKGVVVQAADGVLYPGVRVAGHTSHVRYGPGGNLELLGDDDRCGCSVQLQFYTVVQTALAAGTSVPDS